MTDETGIEIVEGDITRVPADAIVNAANAELTRGGGVCGAIFQAAGVEKLTEACSCIGVCRTGSAVLTPAFSIESARHIVHAVGPVYARYSKEEARGLLRSAYKAAIGLAFDQGHATIAFPAIGTGIYGYPLEEACRRRWMSAAARQDDSACGSSWWRSIARLPTVSGDICSRSRQAARSMVTWISTSGGGAET